MIALTRIILFIVHTKPRFSAAKLIVKTNSTATDHRVCLEGEQVFIEYFVYWSKTPDLVYRNHHRVQYFHSLPHTN